MKSEQQDPELAGADLAVGFDRAEPVEVLAAGADTNWRIPRDRSGFASGSGGEPLVVVVVGAEDDVGAAVKTARQNPS